MYISILILLCVSTNCRDAKDSETRDFFMFFTVKLSLVAI